MEPVQEKYQAEVTEYKEVCQNIRESWTYITTLIRQYLAIQILLLSIVGLGTSIPTAATSSQQATSQSQSSSVSSETALEARGRKLARSATIIVLMLIGGGLSLGAWAQSRRLYENSTNFVKRAAAIEREIGARTLELKKDDDAKTTPLHQYMHSRLIDGVRFNMQYAVQAMYLAGFIMWAVLGFFYIGPVVLAS